MNKLGLQSLVVVVFVVAGCRGNEAADTLQTAESLKSKLTARAVATPPPTSAPAPVTSSTSSLLPFIDVNRIPAPEVGYSTARIMPVEPGWEAPTQNTDGTGQFRITCTFSHMAFNDPIVYPGKQGAAHLHTFFGNTAIDHNSTQQSIETSGNSTCTGGTANRTGYWVPAVIDTKDGTPLKPSKIMVYYKTSFLPNSNVKPFPAGLRMIAGDMKASAPQEHIYWECRKDGESGPRTSTIPTNCPVGYLVEATISFPYCWDGTNLDSPDHKSHMSYEVQLQSAPFTKMCPASHPVELPVISEMVRYVVAEEGSSARWRLSSDNYGTDKLGGYSLHADWFNGWDAKVQDIWIKNCLQAKKDCHAFLLGDGTALF